MHHPDIDELPFEDLNNEIRLRARIYEGHKHTIRNPEKLYDLQMAKEKLPLAYDNLQIAVAEWCRRMMLVCN